MPSRSRASIIVPALAAAIVSAAPGETGLSQDEVVALLQAGVGESIILRQLDASGRFAPIGVAEILEIKKAGGTDRLLEALLTAAEPEEPQAPASPPAAEPPEPGFRIFKEVGEDGEEVLHITNLDAAGRRLGGPVTDEPASIPNPYAPRDEAFVEDQPWEEGGDPGGEVPVVVNVYTTPPQAPESWTAHEPSPYMYRDPYAYKYPRGRLPGYYTAGHYGQRQHIGCDPRGVPSPPGSYSHYQMNHGQRSHLYNGSLAYSNRTSSGPLQGLQYRPIGFAAGWESLHRYRSRFQNGR